VGCRTRPTGSANRGVHPPHGRRAVADPVGSDGHAGRAVRYASDPRLLGADDLTFDANGNLYLSSSRLNTLTRVSPGGEITGLADASDGLDYTAGIEFGRTPRDRRTLYIVDVGGNFNQPKLQAARIHDE
jgi:hypothetical protein